MADNREDQPLSSEELLRRAREGLGEGGSALEPPKDFTIESYPPPVARSDRPATPEVPADFEEPAGFEETETASPFETATPAVGIPEDTASWAPPPLSGDEPAPGPAPESAPRRGGSVFGKLWIVVVLIVGGFALFSFFDSSKTVDEIAVGDCLDTPEDDVFFEIDPINCTEAHDLEVFAIVDLSTVSSEFSLAAPYPGDDAVYDAALNACYDRFEGYVGMPYEESVLFMDAFTPTLEGWNEVEDRVANCVLFEVNASQTEIVKSTQSLRNAGR